MLQSCIGAAREWSWVQIPFEAGIFNNVDFLKGLLEHVQPCIMVMIVRGSISLGPVMPMDGPPQM